MATKPKKPARKPKGPEQIAVMLDNSGSLCKCHNSKMPHEVALYIRADLCGKRGRR